MPRYRMPLEILVICFEYKEEKSVWIEEKQHTLTLHLPSKPRVVCVDSEFKTLKALSLDLPPEELLALLTSCPHIYSRIMAARELSKKASPAHIDEL